MAKEQVTLKKLREFVDYCERCADSNNRDYEDVKVYIKTREDFFKVNNFDISVGFGANGMSIIFEQKNYNKVAD